MRRTPAPGSGGRTAAGPFRGVLVGASVATLAVAAHGLAGGGWPGSAALTLLLFAAAGIGAIATLLPVPSGTPSRAALLTALAAGQLAAHLALSVPAGPDPMAMGRESCGAAGTFLAAAGLPDGPMAAAHAIATLLCATLIAVAERLYSVVSRAIRTLTAPIRPLPTPRAARWLDAPFDLHRFLHAGSLGSRAPPLSA
ncbi:hypothetical protein [Nocardia macrotermitis]|uniref:Uncharacterized protein n=1 Tax=Nocardia macrotermitis TaxID=2585198 RepID=A0A7K0D9D5_9NOCA|nr:hypothetical protein [Nocardia macrotermitis]MQY22337.1 hypothetical protein [Nocardia macrotermitis]